MILLIDNYDNFVFNLARYLHRLGEQTHIVRNDAIDSATVEALAPQAIVLSPGPCTPREAGASIEMVRTFHEQLPILGVCLGHQVIAEALGGQVIRAATPRHGQTSPVFHSGSGLFAGLPSPLQACRYHSLVVDPATLPATFRVTATTDDHVLMAIEHVELPVFGLQFHPEAILTEGGYRLLANFLKLAGCHTVANPDRLTADEHLRTERDTSPLPTAPVTF